MVADLTTGENVSSKSTPGRCKKPRTTQRALYLSSEPSALNLCQKSHFPETMLAPCGRGTSDHVWFAIKALYSSCIAVSQWGSRNASFTLLGRGEMSVVVVIARLAYLGFG